MQGTLQDTPKADTMSAVVDNQQTAVEGRYKVVKTSTH